MSLHRDVCSTLLVLTGMSGLEVQRCAGDASRVNRWAGLTTHKHWTREITSSTNRVQRVRSLTPAMSALALQVLKQPCSEGSDANGTCGVPCTENKKTSDLQFLNP